jgi:hypothetical protein
MTKLHINLSIGTLEVEGEETFVTAVYNDFKAGLLSAAANAKPEEKNTPVERPKVTNEAPANKPRTKRTKASHSLIKDLDLSTKANPTSLKDFHITKQPASAMECNAVFVYYLQQIAQVPTITLDHVFTCYKEAGVRVPTALKQSLADTASRRGWIDTSSFDDIKIAVRGENFVEHDLPKKGAKEE